MNRTKIHKTREITNQHPVLTNFVSREMYNLLMIVYGELLFIENMIIGWVLLYLTGEICGRRAGDQDERSTLPRVYGYKWRLLAGGVMCGAFSLVVFLDVKAPVTILMEVCFAFVACAVTFGSRKNRGAKPALRHTITFILITYFMGGMTMGLLLVTKHQGIYTAVGIYTGDMKAAALALFIALGYMTLSQIIKTIKKHKLYEEHSYDVIIYCGEKNIVAKAFLDTGNHLNDPISGRPVAVASEDLWRKMQRLGIAQGEGASVNDREGAACSRFVLIPYETVGSKGLLEGIRVEHIDIGERRIKGCIIARGSGTFDFGCGGSGGRNDKYNGAAGSEHKYELLLSAEMKGETGLW